MASHKAALDAFSRCLSAEAHTHKIAITSVYMPLVRTPMIAPTKIYKYVPTLSPLRQAADLIAYAIVKRPYKIASTLGSFGFNHLCDCTRHQQQTYVDWL